MDWKDFREEERSLRRASGSLLAFICTEDDDGLLPSFMWNIKYFFTGGYVFILFFNLCYTCLL